MISNILRHTAYFICLLIFQVAFIDQFNLGSLFRPGVMILSLILLPVNTSREWTLVIAFLQGLVLDTFFDTLGVQVFSLVFIAFIRPYVLMFFMDKESLTKNADPNIRMLGWQLFVLYAGILTFVYHFIVCFVELSSFHIFLHTFLSVICSSALTLLLIVLFQLLLSRKERTA